MYQMWMNDGSKVTMQIDRINYCMQDINHKQSKRPECDSTCDDESPGTSSNALYLIIYLFIKAAIIATPIQ